MTQRPDAIDDLVCDFGPYLTANMLDGDTAGTVTMTAHTLVEEVLELLHDYLRDRQHPHTTPHNKEPIA